jgi:SAM-dependent methyltransferase
MTRQEEELIGRSGHLVGIDPEEAAVRANASISGGAVAFGGGLPFRDQSFDLVTANMVAEHLEDPEEDLREIYRVLKPGGKFVFITPNRRGYLVRLASPIPQGLRGLLVRLVEERASDDHFETHYRLNTVEDVETVGAQVGFEVEECRLVLSAAEFARFPPIALVELAWLRALSSDLLARWRPALLPVLQRPA